MAKETGLGARFYLDGFDISGDVGSLQAVSISRAMIDVTGLDKFAHERLLGLGDSEIQFNNWFNPSDGTDPDDPAGAHETLKNVIGGTRHIMYFHRQTAGVPVAAMLGVQANYTVQRATDGALSGSVQAMTANGRTLEWARGYTAGKSPVGPEEADRLLSETDLLNDNEYCLDGSLQDVPRFITITIVDMTGSITAGTVRIIGTGPGNVPQTEDVDIGDGAGTYVTDNRFQSVDSILTLDDVETLDGCSDETIEVGVLEELEFEGIDGNAEGFELGSDGPLSAFLQVFKLEGGAGADITVVLEESDDDGDCDPYAPIADGAFAEVDIADAPLGLHLLVDGPIKRWIRVVVTTDDGFSDALIAVAIKRYGPATEAP